MHRRKEERERKRILGPGNSKPFVLETPTNQDRRARYSQDAKRKVEHHREVERGQLGGFCRVVSFVDVNEVFALRVASEITRLNPFQVLASAYIQGTSQCKPTLEGIKVGQTLTGNSTWGPWDSTIRQSS